ncbi:hypothetical protein ACFW1J_18580 [Priestia aryabhattai]|uniref:hypothetical protein n=1 Tax=Priestia aryabhattai TaxID=412384 RepID=UPI0036707116
MEISIRKILTKTYSLYTFLFVAIFCSQLINVRILNIMYMLTQKVCIFILVLLLFRSVLKQQMLRKLFFWIISMSLVLFLVFYSNDGVLDLIVMFIFIFSMGKLSFDEIIKIDLKVKLFACCLVIALSFLGIIDSQITYSSRGVLRTSLGFIHANILSLIVLNICFDWIYLRFYKLKWFEYIFIFFIAFILYFTTNSLTSISALFFLVAFNIIVKCVKKLNIGYTVLNVLMFMVVPMAFLFSLYIAVSYSPSNNFLMTLNELWTGRVASVHDFYDEYGVSFFGQSIEMISTAQAAEQGVSPHVLDNGYMRLLLRFGMVVTVILLGMLIKLNFQLLCNKRYALVACLNSYCIIGLMESSFYRIEYNPFLLALIYAFGKGSFYNSSEKNNSNITKKLNTLISTSRGSLKRSLK